MQRYLGVPVLEIIGFRSRPCDHLENPEAFRGPFLARRYHGHGGGELVLVIGKIRVYGFGT
jgi:hypothetical protein